MAGETTDPGARYERVLTQLGEVRTSVAVLRSETESHATRDDEKHAELQAEVRRAADLVVELGAAVAALKTEVAAHAAAVAARESSTGGLAEWVGENKALSSALATVAGAVLLTLTAGADVAVDWARAMLAEPAAHEERAHTPRRELAAPAPEDPP